MRGSLEERFWAKVRKAEGDGCWEWQGCTRTCLYGQIRVNGRLTVAHRVSYELNVGPIPDGLLVLHTCDNRKCARPSHLFLGTQKENCEDCVRKGRHNKLKLTPEIVREIRAMVNSGVRQKEICVRFKLAKSTVSEIVNKKNWTHV